MTEHLALGYASTVHSVQGRTADTAHAVVTPRTSPAALYVGLSRGRQANTAYVTTPPSPTPTPTPAPPTRSDRRDPLAVLARRRRARRTRPGRDRRSRAGTPPKPAAWSARSPSASPSVRELATASRTATCSTALVDPPAHAQRGGPRWPQRRHRRSLRVLPRGRDRRPRPRPGTRVTRSPAAISPTPRGLASVLPPAHQPTPSTSTPPARYADWTPKVDEPNLASPSQRPRPIAGVAATS